MSVTLVQRAFLFGERKNLFFDGRGKALTEIVAILLANGSKPFCKSLRVCRSRSQKEAQEMEKLCGYLLADEEM